MDYDIRDIQYSLYKYYEELMNQYHKTKMNNQNSMSLTKSKKKFSSSTLSRLCPSKKEVKVEKKEINFYVDKLVKVYYNANQSYTNNDKILYETWEKISEEEKVNL